MIKKNLIRNTEQHDKVSKMERGNGNVKKHHSKTKVKQVFMFSIFYKIHQSLEVTHLLTLLII